MKISPRRRIERHQKTEHESEPLFLWWMPAAGLVLAAGWGMWEAVNGSDDSAGDRLSALFEGLIWPGVLIFVVTTFLVWLAWKVEFE